MSSTLNTLLMSWKDFNIVEAQHLLDKTASEITTKQDESELSRKKLVEQLKDFKANSSEESRSQAASIIRGFQNEVDFLNKRSNHAETCFLKAYQKFLDIVDPTPSLEYCIIVQKRLSRLEDLEIECQNLRDTLTSYNEEFRDIRNQDVTIKNLKEKLKKYETRMEDTVLQKIKDAEKRLTDQYQEKEHLLVGTHKHTLQKLQEAESQQKILEQNLDQSQSELFEFKAKHDDNTVARTDAMDIIMNDLDRANLLNASLQKDISNLQKQLEMNQTTSASGTQDINTIQLEFSSLEAELQSKDREINQLMDDLKSLQSSTTINKETSSQIIQQQRDGLDENKIFIANLEDKLLQQKDYDEIKRELAIIKSVEFSFASPNGKEVSAVKTSKPLELLLLEKNKFLQNENTTLKLKAESLSENVSSFELMISDLQTQNADQGKLIMELESDVLAIKPHSPLQIDEVPSQLTLLSEAVKEINMSSLDYEVESAVKRDNHSKLDNNLPKVSENISSSESLLPIVSAQRERFRQRNNELEAQLTSKNNQILSLQNEVESLRGDNIKLYEKIRFLQSVDINKTLPDSLAESRYSNQYESTLDPFSTFSQREKQRKYSSLGPFEKITLFFGRFILQNKTARTAAFFYIAFVHCLIFFVLFILANTESCKREVSSDCAKMFMEHMHDVHGNNEFIVP